MVPSAHPLIRMAEMWWPRKHAGSRRLLLAEAGLSLSNAARGTLFETSCELTEATTGDEVLVPGSRCPSGPAPQLEAGHRGASGRMWADLSIDFDDLLLWLPPPLRRRETNPPTEPGAEA